MATRRCNPGEGRRSGGPPAFALTAGCGSQHAAKASSEEGAMRDIAGFFLPLHGVADRKWRSAS